MLGAPNGGCAHAGGKTNIAARYRSATREVPADGDLHEIIPARHGIRVIIGDVSGMGLDAVRLEPLPLRRLRGRALLAWARR
jgi:serine phosphatase RsbU (regulator of sigma subunit)